MLKGIDEIINSYSFKTASMRKGYTKFNIACLWWQRLEQLKELAKAHADYEPYKAVHDMSKSLSRGRNLMEMR